MAAAVFLNLSLADWLREEFRFYRNDEMAWLYSDDELRRLVLRHTTPTPSTFLFQGVGSGEWMHQPLQDAPSPDGMALSYAAAPFAGVDDHLYVLHPLGTMLAYAIRGTGTATSTHGQLAKQTLIDSAGTFTTEATVGDVVAHTRGAVLASVQTVTSNTELTTLALPSGMTFRSGDAYTIGRASTNSDTAASYSVSARLVNLRACRLAIIERLVAQFSKEHGKQIDGMSISPAEAVRNLKAMRGHLVGVEAA